MALGNSSDFTQHNSEQDASVNWDRSVNIGRLETRYVRRCPDYLSFTSRRKQDAFKRVECAT